MKSNPFPKSTRTKKSSTAGTRAKATAKKVSNSHLKSNRPNQGTPSKSTY